MLSARSENTRYQIVALAAQHRIPAIYYLREFAEVGGLMAYGNRVAPTSSPCTSILRRRCCRWRKVARAALFPLKIWRRLLQSNFLTAAASVCRITGIRLDCRRRCRWSDVKFGLAGVNLATWTGFGSVTYWNAYVAGTQMHGAATFFDARFNNRDQYPVSAMIGSGNTRNTPDKTTAKLAALHFYQL